MSYLTEKPSKLRGFDRQ